ncbi:hypothetical protein [Streptomyces sviceus]
MTVNKHRCTAAADELLTDCAGNEICALLAGTGDRLMPPRRSR